MDKLVSKARDIALQALKDETRYDGTPFIVHAENVAKIAVDEIGLSPICAVAVYLHEATRTHKDIDISEFPKDVREIVDGLNKISTIKPKDTKLEAENYKRLIVQYSTDPRVIVLKIADRLEVMRNLSIFPKSSREQKLLETTMLYMPLAHQLGLYNINNELGDIYLRYSDPEQYRSISNKLKATEQDRQKITAEFILPLEKKLEEAGIKYKLKARTKSAYSIYRKMQIQKVPFEGVFDVFAIRFIIDCEEDPKIEKDLCWKVYSYVTEEYTPDTKRLRDWLTTPRPNGYESLHITVANKQGNSLEVQIRTKRMDFEAENGSAAHWAYKGIRHEQSTENWLSSVREALENPLDRSPNHIPLPPANEIFIFTPSGELRILPKGASVLDFAFNIHTGLGCKCIGAKINGKSLAIREKLQTGDVVEIITSKNQKPNQDWLNCVITSKARTKIKQELDALERKKAEAGREILERRLKNWKLEFPDDMAKDYMKAHKYNSMLAFMADIEAQKVDLNELKSFILKAVDTTPATIAQAITTKEISTNSDDILVISAKNVKGLDYKLSKCCNPVFGDDVFGFVTRTEGIKIHRMSCPNAERLIEKYPYRIQKVVWQDNSSNGEFLCNLIVSASIESTVMTKVMEVISKFRAALKSFNVKTLTNKGLYEFSIKLLVPSNTELDKIISQINAIKNVHKVRRA